MVAGPVEDHSEGHHPYLRPAGSNLHGAPDPGQLAMFVPSYARYPHLTDQWRDNMLFT